MQRRRDLRCADPAVDFPRLDDTIDDHGHLVQFYESDSFLAESVKDFVLAGLERGESAVIVATKAHRMAIDELIESSDLDVQRLRNEGRYVLLDAAETLSRFMVDGEPEPALFSAAVGSLVARAAETGEGVRIFGEMVALLWKEGNIPAALRLEELWNELAQAHPFSLLCGYPMSGFADAGPFRDVCSLHTRVIPTESYTGLSDPDERMRAVTELQQRSFAIDSRQHDRALQLNDEIVQGLATAKMALELEAYDVLEETLTSTLERATKLVSSLIDHSNESQVVPGSLRRHHSAG